MSGSSTSTGKPLTALPSACHAYRWRSSPAAMMSSPWPAAGSRLASTGEVRKPPSVRSRTPARWAAHDGSPAQRRARVVAGSDVCVEDQLARRVPRVDVALQVVGDDLRCARRRTGRRRPAPRAPARSARSTARRCVNACSPVCSGSGSVCTGQPGRSLSAAGRRVVLVGVDPAVGVGDDQLVGVVAGEVGEHRAGVAVAAHLEREALEHVLRRGAGTAGGGPRRSSPGPGAPRRGRDDDAHRERVGQRVRAAVGGLREPAAVLVAGERASGRRAGTAPRASRC